MSVLDGKVVSEEIQEQLVEEVERLKRKTGKIPGLTVVLVGEHPASKIYVRSKDKMAAKLGLNSNVIRLDKDIAKEELIKVIKDINEDESVHAALIQLPLPDQFNDWEILDFLSPGKDVDRFLPKNLGMLLLNRTNIYPCTPAGILKVLDYYKIDVKGMDAVVVGRSYIVGKPIAGMLTNRHATVTICHTRTKDLAQITRKADLVVAAIGRPGYITEDMVKDGAVLIDVGINRLDKKEEVLEYCTESQINKFEKKGYGITGDIHIKAFQKAAWYTPVPGGIGRLTVTMLMHNTLELFKEQNNIK
jgi:methylenetetrahydrofolate dehydrogenase (NADP+)/methenyltetrahydrofolate cyclohydrolase